MEFGGSNPPWGFRNYVHSTILRRQGLPTEPKKKYFNATRY
jgi:hypothetical protein